MKRIVCENCGRSYDYDREEFCPRCGAFNQPVKTWGVDAKGNVVRHDGVNEENHKGSFVHQEVHREKDVRRSKGMDWQPPKKAAKPQQSTFNQWEKRKERNRSSAARTIAIIVGVILLINFVIPLLVMFFGML